MLNLTYVVDSLAVQGVHLVDGCSRGYYQGMKLQRVQAVVLLHVVVGPVEVHLLVVVEVALVLMFQVEEHVLGANLKNKFKQSLQCL